LLTFTILNANNLDKLNILTEIYPPFNYKENEQLVGLSVEILEQMLKNSGSKLTKDDFKVLPWARAYNIVQNKKDTMLFTMFRTPAREDLFKWVGPVDSSIVGLIARKDKNIKIKNIEEIKNYKIGTVKDDIAHTALLDSGYEKRKIDLVSGTNSIEICVKKLNSNRIDMFAYLVTMNEWNLDKNFFNPKDYENVFTLLKQDLYFALNKNTDDKIIEKLQSALDELKKDGTYSNIIKKYKQ